MARRIAAGVSGLVAVVLLGGGEVSASPAAASLTGTPTNKGVQLTWRTAQEIKLVGFNMFRIRDQTRIRLNPHVLPAKHSGTVLGASYRYVDGRARPGIKYRYRLQLLRIDGSRSWVGSATVRAAARA